MFGYVDIYQVYNSGHKITSYADSEIFEMLVSIDTANYGRQVDVIASGELYKIINNKDNEKVENINLEPYLKTVRCHENYEYFIIDNWKPEDKVIRGIVRLVNINRNTFDYIYLNTGTYIEDFIFSPCGDNLLYFIERNDWENEVYLKKINFMRYQDYIDSEGRYDVTELCRLPKGTTSLTWGNDDTIYLASPNEGTIMSYKIKNNKEKKWNIFAGNKNKQAFLDGSEPSFYKPQKIKYVDNSLYIWDFNTLRKIIIENEKISDCITLAGQVSRGIEIKDITMDYYKAEDITFSYDELKLADFDFVTIDGKYILLTDPIRGVIWKIE